jgi:hypothetical protein
MSLTPAMDEAKAQKLRKAIELCGKNMGPHDYIPIEWRENDNVKRVTRFLCRICFSNVNIGTLLSNYPDVSTEKEGTKTK